jgi:hypothetical protein
VEVIGEIVGMLELARGARNEQRATFGEKLARSEKVVAVARSHLFRTRFYYTPENRRIA